MSRVTVVLVVASLLGLSPAIRASELPDTDAACRQIAHSLAQGLSTKPERKRLRSIGVRPFVGATERGRAIEQAIGLQLAAQAKAELLDRDKFEAMTREQRVRAGAGSGDPAHPKIPAQALLQGSVRPTADGMLIEASLVWVETGAILASARAVASGAAPATVTRGTVESTNIQVAIRRLADGLAQGFGRLPGNARYRRLAVMPFTEVGEQSSQHHVGVIVTSEISTDLARDHDLLLVERAKLVEVMKEMRLQQSGAVDSQSAAQLGKLADAQALVLGSASDAGDHYLLDARIVATETGETLAAESSSVNAMGMVALASDAVVLRSKKDAVFRSLLIPGWGQIYNRQPTKGYVVLGTEVGLLTSALIFNWQGNQAYGDYLGASKSSLGANPAAEAQHLYDRAAARFRWRNGMLIGAGALWLAQIADAYISGVDGDQLLGVALIPSPVDRGGMLALHARF